MKTAWFFIIMLILVVGAGLVETPVHEGAHLLAGVLAGGTPKGISLFPGHAWIGGLEQGTNAYAFFLAGPTVFWYIPSATLIWIVTVIRRGNWIVIPTLLVVLFGAAYVTVDVAGVDVAGMNQGDFHALSHQEGVDPRLIWGLGGFLYASVGVGIWNIFRLLCKTVDKLFVSTP